MGFRYCRILLGQGSEYRKRHGLRAQYRYRTAYHFLFFFDALSLPERSRESSPTA